MSEDRVIGTGLNVICAPERSSGVVRYLKKPSDVINLVRDGDIENTVVLARAGTVTFVGPVLSRRPAGIITIEGAPQSHLGILAREFGVRAVMSVELAGSAVERKGPDGVTSEAYVDYAAGELDGRRVVLDCSDADTGVILAAD